MSKLSTNKKSFLKNLIENTYGVGIKTGTLFFKKLGLNSRINPRTFKRKQINEITKNSLNTFSGKKLRENTKNTILFLSKNKTYKGIRHKLKYPARGQRTHTNAKTKKKFKY